MLLVNLGTPSSPDPAAVRTYLREFLGDPRVVDWPPVLWKPVLNGIILPVRSGRSAGLYRSIWTQRGSPLDVFTSDLATAVAGHHPGTVGYAMRYGEPSLERTLDRLMQDHSEGVTVLPLFPQYSRTTTESVIDVVAAVAARRPDVPVRVLENFHRDEGWVSSVAAPLRGRTGHVLFSCHGLPERYIRNGDPYEDQCVMSAHHVAAAAGLTDWSVAFQSRFGPETWLEPSTVEALTRLGRSGREVTVVPLTFICDCLETLEELEGEAREAFEAAGGTSYTLEPCLNAGPDWARKLSQLAVSA